MLTLADYTKPQKSPPKPSDPPELAADELRELSMNYTTEYIESLCRNLRHPSPAMRRHLRPLPLKLCRE